MSVEANKALVRRHYEEVWNAGDLDLIEQLFAPEFMVHDEHWGPEGERQWVTAASKAFPDIQFTIEALVAEGDLVVARWSWQATHQGTFMDIPATGRTVSFSGITIYRIENDKLVQDWTEFNWLNLQEQLEGPDQE